MKKLLLLPLLLLVLQTVAQKKITTTNGTITFEASVPVFEEVKAVNTAVTCTITLENSELTCKANMRAFVFKKELMQDHFNRYYIESDRYPQAHFVGIIEKFDLKNVPETPTNYQIKGKLKIHGRTKNISIIAVLQKTKMGIELDSQFDLNTDDFGIVIPNVIIAKVSKTVVTQLHFVLN